jgi:hypothetical protein
LKYVLAALSVALALAASSCAMLPWSKPVEILMQPEKDRCIAIVEGNVGSDALYSQCLKQLAITAKERGFAGFYVYDRDEQKTVVTNSYEEKGGKIRYYDVVTILMKVYAQLAAEADLDIGKYYDAEKLIGDAPKG